MIVNSDLSIIESKKQKIILVSNNFYPNFDIHFTFKNQLQI